MTYRYRTTTGRSLRKGDEVRAADGVSWLAPLRQVTTLGSLVEVRTDRGQCFPLMRDHLYRVRRMV